MERRGAGKDGLIFFGDGFIFVRWFYVLQNAASSLSMTDAPACYLAPSRGFACAYVRLARRTQLVLSPPPCLTSTLIFTEASPRLTPHASHPHTNCFPDLYGNDESEFAVPTEQPEEPAVKSEPSEKQETAKKEASPSPQPAAPAPIASSSTESTQPLQFAAVKEPESLPTNALAPQSQVPVYTSPTTQQIPTYQERQESDYSEMAPQRADSSYPPLDRPVRPSEMKEEG